jgi:hypothetical protein
MRLIKKAKNHNGGQGTHDVEWLPCCIAAGFSPGIEKVSHFKHHMIELNGKLAKSLQIGSDYDLSQSVCKGTFRSFEMRQTPPPNFIYVCDLSKIS